MYDLAEISNKNEVADQTDSNKLNDNAADDLSSENPKARTRLALSATRWPKKVSP